MDYCEICLNLPLSCTCAENDPLYAHDWDSEAARERVIKKELLIDKYLVGLAVVTSAEIQEFNDFMTSTEDTECAACESPVCVCDGIGSDY